MFAAAAAPATQTKAKDDSTVLQAKILSLIGNSASPASVASVASAISKEAASSSTVQAMAKQLLSADQQRQALLAAHQSSKSLLGTQSAKPLLSTPGNKGLLATPNPAQTSGPAAKPSTPVSSSLNLDNPNVKKALDNLIQTGPNLLRNMGGNSQPGHPQNQVGRAGDTANSMGVSRPGVDPNALMQEHQIAKAQVEAIRTMQQLKQAPQNVQQNIQMAGAASLMAAGIRPGTIGHSGMTPHQLHALQAHSMAYTMRGGPPPPPMGPPPGRHMY